MDSPPRKIPEVGLFRQVWQKLNETNEYLRQTRSIGGRNIAQRRTLNGTLTVAEATAGDAGSEIIQLRLKTIQNDFYTCRSWDGQTEGTTDIFVARPFGHRVTNFNGQSIAWSSDGDSFTASYSYSSTTKRTKTISGVAETQVLVPYFKADFDLIYAVEVKQLITIRSGAGYATLTDPNNVPIRLLDLNVEGRAWAKLET